jgi:hypothetical protein
MKLLFLLFLFVYSESECTRGSFVDLTSSNTLTEVREKCLTPKFSREALKQYIIFKQINHPEIAYAQALLETGGFTSRIYRENNNLFGMKLAKKRRTVATGEKYGHAVYNNWQESVDDYLLWQQQFKRTPILTEKQYYRLLDAIYAEDTTYIQVVKIVRKRNDFI